MLGFQALAFIGSLITAIISAQCSKKGRLYTGLLFLVISLMFFVIFVGMGHVQ